MRRGDFGQIILPEFPKRKLFGKTNTSEDSIKNRQAELQAYFNELLSIEKILFLLKEYLPNGNAMQEETKENVYLGDHLGGV
jgi:hypothetical protein